MVDFFDIIVDNILKDISYCDWFRGGSRRFGYERDSSDHDIFLSIPIEDRRLDAATKYLCDHGFELKTSGAPQVFDYSISDSLLYGFSDKIHVIIITNPETFKALKQEHEMVAKFIYDNDVLMKVAHKLRKYLTGSQVYRIFREMAMDARKCKMPK